MSQHWDEFSKSLAEESVPRRESLRRLGAVFAGALFGSLGLKTASAAGQDPCKAFCKCRNKSQQSQCLEACRACNAVGGCLTGHCGAHGCADLESDVFNCGACGYACDEPGPYEYGACISGRCEYACFEGADYCDGICTPLLSDPNNCGACGRVCPAAAPFCSNGLCRDENCGGVDLLFNSSNCGFCGNVCPWQTYCAWGVCTGGGGGDYGY